MPLLLVGIQALIEDTISADAIQQANFHLKQLSLL